MELEYTVPDDERYPAQLRGKTLSGGTWARLDGRCLALDETPDAVLFWVDAQPVRVRICGRPELESLLSAHQAACASRQSVLDSIGWPQYQEALRVFHEARDAYARAASSGYPAREAVRLTEAEIALDALRDAYPLAHLYSLAEGFARSAHPDKCVAGRRAMAAIEAGEDPAAAIDAMHAQWRQACDETIAGEVSGGAA